jgi:ABC-type transport system involved in multi-copper enzyme maturation permease subunit
MQSEAQESKRMFLPARAKTVVMGRQGYLNVVLRLIGVELYKLRRRTLSRVLIAISTLAMLLVFTIIGITAAQVESAPLSQFMHTTSNGTVSPTQASALKQEQLLNVSAPLRFPGSLIMTTQVLESVGLVLIIILAGTIVGGEYSVGTVRLMFTRGPTRTQFLLAKLGATAICIFAGTLGLILFGGIIGTIFNVLVGGGYSGYSTVTTWLPHAILYTLASMLQLFMYAVLAICLSILGRGTVAGVAGTLIWWVLENLLGDLLRLIGAANQGLLGSFAQALPDYFISSNLGVLLDHQRQYLVDSTPTIGVTDLHALLVLACYVIVLLSLAWWVNKERDIV